MRLHNKIIASGGYVMKKLILLCVVLFSAFSLAGCASAKSGGDGGKRTDGGKVVEIMYIYINGNKLKAELEDNSSASALTAVLKEKDIVYIADDYGGFEKVGNLGFNLPTNDKPTSTTAGDVVLYQGNSLCLYYGENSWTFTRIGRIVGYSSSEINTLLGAGNGSQTVTLSLK